MDPDQFGAAHLQRVCPAMADPHNLARRYPQVSRPSATRTDSEEGARRGRQKSAGFCGSGTRARTQNSRRAVAAIAILETARPSRLQLRRFAARAPRLWGNPVDRQFAKIAS